MGATRFLIPSPPPPPSPTRARGAPALSLPLPFILALALTLDLGSITLNDVKSSCFGSPEQLRSCNATDMCAGGRKEKLCGVCEDTHYYYSHGKVCLQCARGHVRVLTVLIMLSVLVIVLTVAFVVVYYTSCIERLTDTGLCAYVQHPGSILIRTNTEITRQFAQRHPFTYHHLTPHAIIPPPSEALAKCLRSKGAADMGSFKVIWSSLQILGSMKASTGVGWPQPFATVASWYVSIHRHLNQC